MIWERVSQMPKMDFNWNPEVAFTQAADNLTYR